MNSKKIIRISEPFFFKKDIDLLLNQIKKILIGKKVFTKGEFVKNF